LSAALSIENDEGLDFDVVIVELDPTIHESIKTGILGSRPRMT